MAIYLYIGDFFVGHWLLLVLLLFFEIHPRPRRSGHSFGTHGKSFLFASDREIGFGSLSLIHWIACPGMSTAGPSKSRISSVPSSRWIVPRSPAWGTRKRGSRPKSNNPNPVGTRLPDSSHKNPCITNRRRNSLLPTSSLIPALFLYDPLCATQFGLAPRPRRTWFQSAE